MAARGRRVRGLGGVVGGRSIVRQTDWGVSIVSTSYTSIAASSKVLLSSLDLGTVTQNIPGTFVRTRGFISWMSTITGSLSSIGGFGVGFVSSVALAAGIASIPGPVTDPLWEGWFVYETFGLRTEVATAVGSKLSQIRTIDSKAMRKVDGDVSLVVVAEAASASPFVFALGLRFLLKAV